MNKIFVDSDIILDLLLKREPHYSAAFRLFSLAEMGEIIAYTSPVVVSNIYYISAKLSSKSSALKNIKKLLTFLSIAAIDEKIVLLSVDSNFKDFEDALQYYTAKNLGVSCLITRNKADYKVTDLTICTADEFLKIYYPI